MITVILNIFSDYIGRYLVAERAGKIAVFSKFSSPKDASSLPGAHEKSRSQLHSSVSLLPWKYYNEGETTEIGARDPGQLPACQSQTHGSAPCPQIHSSHSLRCHLEVSISDASESIPDGISCHIPHVPFFAQSCAIKNTFVSAYDRKIVHPRRPRYGVCLKF